MIQKSCILPVGRFGQRVFSVAIFAIRYRQGLTMSVISSGPADGGLCFIGVCMGLKKGELLALLLFSVCRYQFIDIATFVVLLI